MIAIVPPRLPPPDSSSDLPSARTGGRGRTAVPATRVAAAVCLFVLMLVMFPASIYASDAEPPKSMTRGWTCGPEEIVYLAAAVLVGLGSIQ
jgi:uncharacterized membrane protein